MNYAALQAEIVLPAYAGMDDDAIAAALNAETVETVRDVPTVDARELLLATGEWGALVLLARSTPASVAQAPVIAAAITAVETLRETTTLEVTKPANWTAMQTLVGTMQQAGVMSEGTGAALLALRDIHISRAAEIGWTAGVSAADVAAARSL
jgi:hypothetical protein